MLDEGEQGGGHGDALLALLVLLGEVTRAQHTHTMHILSPCLLPPFIAL